MIKTTFDANIWYSAVRGGIIGHKLPLIFNNSNVKILTCQHTLNEFDDIMKRPKAQKDLLPQRISEIRAIILAFTEIVPLISPIEIISRDPNDDYLLTFSKDYNLDYLVTGDKDLLVLKSYGQTRILTFAEFIVALEK